MIFLFDGLQGSVSGTFPDFVEIIRCDSSNGWYQHKCILQCLQSGHYDPKGYLYIADDMFINITMMSEYPIDKIWFVDEGTA